MDSELKTILTDYFSVLNSAENIREIFPDIGAIRKGEWATPVNLRYGNDQWDLVEIGLFREDNPEADHEYWLQIFWGDQTFHNVAFDKDAGLSKDDIDGIVNAFMECAEDKDNATELLNAFAGKSLIKTLESEEMELE